jgi:hypothetical protein
MITPMKGNCSGAGRLGCLLLIVTAGLLWGGGQGVYTALSNRQPTVLTYDEYVKTKPHATWLELQECVLSLPQASIRTTRTTNRMKEAFIPIISAPGQKEERTSVLVATTDPATLALLEQFNQTTDEAEKRKLMISNLDRFFPKRTVKGLVRFGIDMNDRDRRKLADLDQNLASDFVIIDEGKEPGLVPSALMLLVGVVLAAWSLRRSTR